MALELPYLPVIQVPEKYRTVAQQEKQTTFLSVSAGIIVATLIFACQLNLVVHIFDKSVQCATTYSDPKIDVMPNCTASIKGILGCDCHYRNDYDKYNSSKITRYKVERRYDYSTTALTSLCLIAGSITFIANTLHTFHVLDNQCMNRELIGFFGLAADFFGLLTFGFYKSIYYLDWSELSTSAWLMFLTSLYGIIHTRVPGMFKRTHPSWYTLQETIPVKAPTEGPTINFFDELLSEDSQCCKVVEGEGPEVTVCRQCGNIFKIVLIPILFVMLCVTSVATILLQVIYLFDLWWTVLYIMFRPSAYGVNIRILLILAFPIYLVEMIVAILIVFGRNLACIFAGAFVVPFHKGWCTSFGIVELHFRQSWEYFQCMRVYSARCRENIPEIGTSDVPLLILLIYTCVVVIGMVIVIPFLMVTLAFRLPMLIIHIGGRYLQRKRNICLDYGIIFVITLATLFIYAPALWIALCFVEAPLWLLYGIVDGWQQYSSKLTEWSGLRGVITWCVYVPSRIDSTLVNITLGVDPGPESPNLPVWWVPLSNEEPSRV